MRFLFTLTSIFLIIYPLFTAKSFINETNIENNKIWVIQKNNIINIIYNDKSVKNDSNFIKDDFFIVTAYYSPLPNQKYYLKWNYEAEKRLNWEWIKWASGKWVFSWMLAWPKNYRFWTKIYLEWLWVWAIEDRWWAIVNAWKRGYWYDRIDIWVWYWDEWLRRALYWWKRKIKWKIIDSNSKITLNYNNLKSPLWVTNKLVKTKKVKSIKDEYYNLQDILTKLWLYNWDIDWDYLKIKEIIISYQIDKKIIKSRYSYWAWYYWPKTRKNIKQDFDLYLEKENYKNLLLEKYNQIEKMLLEKVNVEITQIWSINYWNSSFGVRIFQKKLSKLWYFKEKDTAFFWDITKKSLINYQIEKNIISNSNEQWAWIFWPKTKKQLKKDLKQLYLDEFLLNENFTKEELMILLEYKNV